MQFAGFLLFIIAWCAHCKLATADSSFHGPQTFDELSLSLQNLAIDGVKAIPKTQELSTKLTTNVSSRGCTFTCGLLSTILSSIVSEQGSPTYDQQQSRYWSNQQAETKPTCRVAPTNAQEVSATLLITAFFQCPFAVKSGGHAAFAGASNIQGGVTIDLANLNQVQVSADRTVTQVGAGNRWLDVYSHLDPQELSVVGGRVADIGVGGLTLGGGISFFSGRYGWACDGVRNYQVVLANGQITNVNQQSYPDLYFALRGGGNNFGIVTRFDLETFPQGQMWGGMTVHPLEANVSVYNAFNNFAKNASNDPDAALITAVAFAQGQYFISNDYEYAKPVVNPPIFHEFTSIPNITSTTRITSLSSLTRELNASNPSGFRETYTTATFKNNPELQIQILDFFHEEVENLKDAKGFLPALVMQPITKAMISHFSKNGGNALGIKESDGPLNLLNLAFMWTNPSDDSRIIAATRRIISNANAAAKRMGLDYKYIYQNYASLDQSVFASYGAANQQRLISISKRFDPDQVFQKLQPGYFKLSGVNGGSAT
ncbi:hypothetical protein ACLMJK_006255 [Lecanora helva]